MYVADTLRNQSPHPGTIGPVETARLAALVARTVSRGKNAPHPIRPVGAVDDGRLVVRMRHMASAFDEAAGAAQAT